jgi:cysteine desulfurase/selenocysteine lyase
MEKLIAAIKTIPKITFFITYCFDVYNNYVSISLSGAKGKYFFRNKKTFLEYYSLWFAFPFFFITIPFSPIPSRWKINSTALFPFGNFCLCLRSFIHLVSLVMNDTIRNDFPILQRTVYGKPLVYLDNAATTQKPRRVVEKIRDEYYNVNANIHRGVHFLSQQATEAHEEARRTVQRFINAAKPEEIIFTRGTTESINLVASSFVYEFMSPGDEIILSGMEHHSNIVPWQMQAARYDISVKVIPVTGDGELDLEAFERLFTGKTKLVSVTHVSNVLGTVNPVKEVVGISHEHNVPVLVDGAQAVAHQSVDVRDSDADFYAFSGHKVFGPTGIGVLYGKEMWLDRLPPYQGGGEMIASVSFEKTRFNDLPFKFEAGTPDYVGSTALAVALDYVREVGLTEIAAYEEVLLRDAVERLSEVNGLRIFGQARNKCGVLSFRVGDIHPYDMGMLLDRLGVAVRTGHHCAEPLMRLLGVEEGGTVRASFAFYNTGEDVERLVAGIEQVRRMF